MLIVLVGALSCAGSSAAATAKEVPAFHYEFRVTSVTLEATFTSGSATATTALRLAGPVKARTLRWYGTKGTARGLPWNGSLAVPVRMAGTATYGGLADPACNGTVTLDTSRWRPIWASLTLTYSWLGTRRAKLTASAGRFPVATTYPARNRACEAGALTWWQPGLVVELPFAFVKRRSFSTSASGRETFDDGSALEWRARMSVRTIRYRAVDCARTVWC